MKVRSPEAGLRGTRLVRVAGALALLGWIAGCAPSSTARDAKPAPLQVTVRGTEMQFVPAEVRASVGQRVVVVFENRGTTEHDLNFVGVPASGVKAPKSAAHGTTGHSGSDVHVAVKAGGNATLEFVPQKKGTYEFVCTVPGHKDAGMKGTLRVD